MTRTAFAETRGGFHRSSSSGWTTLLCGGALALLCLLIGPVAEAAAAPVAYDDTYTVNEDSIFNEFDVKANDTDAGSGVTIDAITPAQNGFANVDCLSECVTYTPNDNFCGGDSFTYTLRGGSTATVTVTVICVAEPTQPTDPAAAPRPQSTISLKLNPNSTAPSENGQGNTRVTASGTAGYRGVVSLYYAAPTLYEGENNGNPSCPATEPSGNFAFRLAGPAPNVTGPQQVADSGPYSLTFVADLEQGGRTQFCGYLRVYPDQHHPGTQHTASLDAVVQSNLPSCPAFNGLTILSAEQASAPGAVGMAAKAKVTYLAPSFGEIEYDSSLNRELRGGSIEDSVPRGGRNTSTFYVYSTPVPFSPGNKTVRFTFRFRSSFYSDPEFNKGCAKANQRTLTHLPPGPEQSFSVIFGTAGGLSASLYPSGPASQIGSVLRTGGYSAPSRAAEPATYKVAWYATPGGSARRGSTATASAAAPVLIASGTRVARRAGKGVLKVRLTKKGKALLRKSKRLKVTIKGSVNPRRGKTVKKTTRTTLKR